MRPAQRRRVVVGRCRPHHAQLEDAEHGHRGRDHEEQQVAVPARLPDPDQQVDETQGEAGRPDHGPGDVDPAHRLLLLFALLDRVFPEPFVGLLRPRETLMSWGASWMPLPLQAARPLSAQASRQSPASACCRFSSQARLVRELLPADRSLEHCAAQHVHEYATPVLSYGLIVGLLAVTRLSSQVQQGGSIQADPARICVVRHLSSVHNSPALWS